MWINNLKLYNQMATSTLEMAWQPWFLLIQRLALTNLMREAEIATTYQTIAITYIPITTNVNAFGLGFQQFPIWVCLNLSQQPHIIHQYNLNCFFELKMKTKPLQYINVNHNTTTPDLDSDKRRLK